jgi:hypothetical protein
MFDASMMNDKPLFVRDRENVSVIDLENDRISIIV